MRFKKIISPFLIVVFLLLCSSAAYAGESTVLAKFFFEQTNFADDSLNVTYGGSADKGYGATSGIFADSSRLFSSVTGTSFKKLEWSNYEGASGNDYKDSNGDAIGSVPVMAAGSKNNWGSASVAPPYFQIVTSTEGYENITFSAELGGSKKGAKNFALSYSLDGSEFVNIENSSYTISANKTMEKAYSAVPLPPEVSNAKTLYIRIYAKTDDTIGGALLSDAPDGGENAVNNVSVVGSSVTGAAPWQPKLETESASITDNILSVSVRNISTEPISASCTAALYNSGELVTLFSADTGVIGENKRYTVKYDTSDIVFDTIKVFNWGSLTSMDPLCGAKTYEKEAIICTPPTPSPSPSPIPDGPAYKDIPIVTLTGDITGISRDNYKDVTLTYKSATEEFSSYASIKWQGRSSVTQGYPKYNYSLKMFTDEERTSKYKRTFKDWLPAHNYCLKANWIDSTHARNIVNARLAEKIQSSPLPTGASGLVDGFPIHVYLNGEDQGIYTWNIPKKGWTFNMDSSNPDHIAFGGEQQTGACLFQKESVSDSDWEMIYPDASDTARDKLNRLIRFVRDSSVEEFKAHAAEYLDINSAVNYYVFSHIIAHTDGYAKNMILVTFDGNIWYPSLYDMDSTYGLHWRGNTIISPDVLLDPSNTDGAMYNTSLLWAKLEKAFGNEIYDRYTEMISNEMSEENIVSEFQYFIDGVGQELYDLDEKVWENKSSKHRYIPSRNFRLDQIKTYIEARRPYLDKWMAGLKTA